MRRIKTVSETRGNKTVIVTIIESLGLLPGPAPKRTRPERPARSASPLPNVFVDNWEPPAAEIPPPPRPSDWPAALFIAAMAAIGFVVVAGPLVAWWLGQNF